MPDAPGTGLYIQKQDGSYYHDTGGIAGGRRLTKDEYNKLLSQNPNISALTVTEDQYKKGDYKLPPVTGIPRGPTDEPFPPRDIGAIGSPENKIIRYLPDGTPVTADQGGVVGPRDTQQQIYNDLLAKSFSEYMARTQPQVTGSIGGFIPTPVQPTPAAQPSTQPATPTIPVPQARQNQQAMQNYANLLNQGLANYRAQTGQPTFGQPKQQTPRNISTAGFPTPKPFG